MSITNDIKSDTITPLPILSLSCAIFVQISECLLLEILFPFLVFMIEDFGYSHQQQGYYTGLLAASFCSAQFCTSMLWGQLSDKYGRKTAIIAGTLGSIIGLVIFGTAKTYSQAMIGRIVSGLLTGNLAVLKSYVMEITDETNRGKGFSYLTMSWTTGSVLAPLAGGLLSKPTEQYPYLFKNNHIFNMYPYLLPCLFCIAWNIFTIICCMLFMTETFQHNNNCNSTNDNQSNIYRRVNSNEDNKLVNNIEDVHNISIHNNEEHQTTVYDEENIELIELKHLNNENHVTNNTIQSHEVVYDETIPEFEEENTQKINDDTVVFKLELPPLEDQSNNDYILRDKIILLVAGNYGILSAAAIIQDETLPLFLKADIEEGGLSFTSNQIGKLLAITGIGMLLVTIGFLPYMSQWSKFHMLEFGVIYSIPITLSLPLIASFYRWYLFNNPWKIYYLWILLIITCTIKILLSFLSFTAVNIQVSNSVISKHLGVVNGLSQSFGSLARGIGPALGGLLWSIGIMKHFVYLNFIFASILFVFCLIINRILPRSLDFQKIE